MTDTHIIPGAVGDAIDKTQPIVDSRGIITRYGSPDPMFVSKLPKPTKKENPKGQCSVCGGWHGLPAVHLDYVGHADTTRILIEIDPDWSWEPIAWTPEGAPATVERNGQLVMWGRLTLLGKTLPCVGVAPAGKEEVDKELIGDLLRNGAMRFGVALSLWQKQDRHEAQTEQSTSRRTSRAAVRAAKPAQDQKDMSPVEQVAARFDITKNKVLVDAREWAAQHGFDQPTKPEQISEAMLDGLTEEYERARIAEEAQS